MTTIQAPVLINRTGYTNHAAEKVTIWHKSGKATGGVPVILCHGYIGSGLQWADVSVTGTTAPRIGRAGITAYGTDNGGASTWGNAAMVSAIDDTITWGAANYGTRTDLAALIMLSHGVTALNWIWRNPTKLVAASLCIPATSLVGLHDRDPGGLGIQASIDAAYVDHAGYLAAISTRDPSHVDNMALLAPLAAKMQIWASSNDNVCIPAETTAFATGTGIVVNDIGAMGHSFPEDAVQSMVEWMIPRCLWPSN
jgi:hypothetical protein